MKNLPFAFSFWACSLAAASAPPAVPPVLEFVAGGSPSRVRNDVSALTVVSTPFGTSYQVNVDAAGQNIVGDAANEPSLCLDIKRPGHIAVGWRQFNTITSDFRQAGWGYSTNTGVNWTFGGTLETNVFRSDPVLASDADGNFYYLSLKISPNYNADLWRSTNGGANWQRVGDAVGGDKEWFTIDTTSSPGRGNIYQCWSTAANVYTNRIFSRTVDGGTTWQDPIPIPNTPYWATLDIGLDGEVCMLGWNGSAFWFNRSLNATNGGVPMSFDLTTTVDLGGFVLIASNPINPAGLLGQPNIAVDRSTGPTRGNLYALCSVVTNIGSSAQVMFARSTNGGTNWSTPIRINDDPEPQNAWHWFGTLAVAPNGRVDACWNDTRSSTNNGFSELYYASSDDGGITWSTNRAISPAFNQALGYPMQSKMGDYIGMISLNDAACIAYTATFNGEQDVYFISVEQPLIAGIAQVDPGVRLSWDSVAGRTYCVQMITNIALPWSSGSTLGCVTATNTPTTFDDPSASASPQRYYRVVKQP